MRKAPGPRSVMRWSRDGRRVERLFLERQESFGEAVELGAHLRHARPLLGKFSGQILDDARLMGHRFLQPDNALGLAAGHVFALLLAHFPAIEAKRGES